MRNLIVLSSLFIAISFTSCNKSNSEGQITPEGTRVTNTVNSDMEKHRKPADVDTITSPGSNSSDFNGRGNNNNGSGSSTDNGNSNSGSGSSNTN